MHALYPDLLSRFVDLHHGRFPRPGDQVDHGQTGGKRQRVHPGHCGCHTVTAAEGRIEHAGVDFGNHLIEPAGCQENQGVYAVDQDHGLNGGQRDFPEGYPFAGAIDQRRFIYRPVDFLQAGHVDQDGHAGIPQDQDQLRK